MITLALYFASAFGLAYIVGHSTISEPVRTWIGGELETPRPYFGRLVMLIECPACFGTWIGMIAGALLPSLFTVDTYWAGAAVGGLSTCAINFLVARWSGLMPDEPNPDNEAMKKLFMMAANQALTPQPIFDDFRPPHPMSAQIDAIIEEDGLRVACFDDACVLSRGHAGQHLDVEGKSFDGSLDDDLRDALPCSCSGSRARIHHFEKKKCRADPVDPLSMTDDAYGISAEGKEG